jgi:hypothetical protein
VKKGESHTKIIGITIPKGCFLCKSRNRSAHLRNRTKADAPGEKGKR